jgi:hypothetical protein
MSQPQTENLETDSRFPSGKWIGYWQQGARRGQMEVLLTFANGVLTGEGRDCVGSFSFRGTYDLQDGKCRWTKHYFYMHNVYYQGYNEGKGIWGVWEIDVLQMGLLRDRGGFHIWPEGMAMDEQMAEEAEADIIIEGSLEPSESITAPLR